MVSEQFVADLEKVRRVLSSFDLQHNGKPKSDSSSKHLFDIERMPRWGLLIFACMFYTSVVTPYEVALLETQFDGLFVINKFVDSVFIADIFLTFRTSYLDENFTVVTDLRQIRNKYLKGWFTVDLVSVLQFDVLELIFHVGSQNDVGQLKAVRMLRVLRLFKMLKMLRVLRASK